MSSFVLSLSDHVESWSPSCLKDNFKYFEDAEHRIYSKVVMRYMDRWLNTIF